MSLEAAQRAALADIERRRLEILQAGRDAYAAAIPQPGDRASRPSMNTPRLMLWGPLWI